MSRSASGNTAELYKADSEWRDQLRKTREKLAGVCGQCMNRRIRVETIDGQMPKTLRRVNRRRALGLYISPAQSLAGT
ncbi:hypothetical protein D9M71_795390 [compost metagenome]|jgi:hypothetical protein